MRLVLISIYLLTWSGQLFAWTGKVVAIHDGDTLSVLQRGRAIKLRLNAIDAPELHQPFGQQSRKSLSSLCYGKFASIETEAHDKYDRVVAQISCSGLNVNAEQIRRGMAWHYLKYSDSAELQGLENEARERRRGLWSSRKPEAPWDYRHKGDNKTQSPELSRRLPASRRCGAKRYCGQMETCGEAIYYLRRCGETGLDGNGDGVPCESLCRP